MATGTSTVTKAVASGTQLQAIGTVKTVVGIVKAVDEGGIERILQAGDLVYPNETIITADNGDIVIEFNNGGFLDLPPSSHIVLDAEVYGPEAPQELAERVQKAIEAGVDPSVAEQAAAGGPLGDEGTSVPLIISFNNSQGSVDSGFPTAPITVSPPIVQEPVLLMQNVAAAVTGQLAQPPGVNTPPVDGDENVSTPENTPISGNVLNNASDADGDTLRVTQFTVAGNPTVFAAGESAIISGVGTLVIDSDGSFTFTPATNFVGTAPVITYTVSDGRGGVDTSTLSIGVTDPPALTSDTITVAEDTRATGNVLGNDSNPDHTLSVTSFNVAGDSAAHAAGDSVVIAGIGTLTIAANGDYIFVPQANWSGSVPQVTYTANSGNTSTLEITVTPVADAPTLNIAAQSVGVVSSTNLIANGSFEDVSGVTRDGTTISDTPIPSGGFLWMQGITGWTLDNGSPTPYMEPHDKGHANVGVPAGGGDNYMDLGASPGDTWIAQTVDGLAEGSTYALSFFYRDKAAMQEAGDAGRASGKMEVLWNGAVIATIDGNNTTAWNNFQTDVVAKSGGNTLAFHEIGTSNDNWGMAIDMVQLSGTPAVHQYSLTLTAGLSDSDGSETLGAVLLAAASLPSGAVLKDGDTVLTATTIDSKSYYEINLGETGGTKTLTLETSSALTDAELNAVSGSVTSTETHNHDTAMTLLGGSGNDILVGSSGNDILIGGLGNDTLTGGSGSDTFTWHKGESGMDTITDFTKGSGGDVLHLSDLLDGATTSTLASGGYLKFSYDEGAGNTKLTIDTNGSAGGGNIQTVILEGVDLTAHNTLSTAAIIHNLLDDGNLKVHV